MSMRIEKRAEQELAMAGVKTAPIPVERVARSLGIKVKRADLGDDCSGILVRNGVRAVIGVNNQHSTNRRLFSIAYEIGHFDLHSGDTYIDRGYRVHFRDLESGSGTKREEMETNAFAAALLRKFKISTQAMTYRLLKLRLISE